MPVYRLGPLEYGFPPAQGADESSGVVAVGGDLHPDRILQAYHAGSFPWFSEGELIYWCSPDPRCVFHPYLFKPSRSLQKKLRQSAFYLSVDRCFTDVMRACAAPRAYAGDTWITEFFIEGYTQLHQRGIAHSIEVWNPQHQLIGGLYGLNLGQIFFGESMFHRETDASKVAFCYLMQLCQQLDIPLVDGQVENPHLMSLGAKLISRDAYLEQLSLAATQASPSWQSLPAFNPVFF